MSKASHQPPGVGGSSRWCDVCGHGRSAGQSSRSSRPGSGAARMCGRGSASHSREILLMYLWPRSLPLPTIAPSPPPLTLQHSQPTPVKLHRYCADPTTSEAAVSVLQAEDANHNSRRAQSTRKSNKQILSVSMSGRPGADHQSTTTATWTSQSTCQGAGGNKV